MATAVSSSHAGCSLLSTPCCSSSSSNEPLKSHPDYLSSSLFTPYFYFGLNLPINQVASVYSNTPAVSHPLPYGPPCVSMFRNAHGSTLPQASVGSYSPHATSPSVSFPLPPATGRTPASAVYDPSSLVASSGAPLSVINAPQLSMSSLAPAPFFVLDPTRGPKDGLIPQCLAQPIPGQRYIDEQGNVYEYVVDKEPYDPLDSQDTIGNLGSEAHLLTPKHEEQMKCFPESWKLSNFAYGTKRKSDEMAHHPDAKDKSSSPTASSPGSSSSKKLCIESFGMPRDSESCEVAEARCSFSEENGSPCDAKPSKPKSKVLKRSGAKSPKNSTGSGVSALADGDAKKRGNPGSGYPGVSWNSRMQAWLAFYMDVDGTRRSHTFKCAKCGGVEAARIQAVNWLSMKRMEIKAAQAHVLLEGMKRHSTS